MMFLAQIQDENMRTKVCENLAAFMMLDGNPNEAVKEQIRALYVEAFGAPKSVMTLDTPRKDTLKKNFCELLEKSPFYGNSTEVRKILFELLSCALCNGTYSEEEREIIEHIAKHFSIKDFFLEEMREHIDTILALNAQSKALIFSERI